MLTLVVTEGGDGGFLDMVPAWVTVWPAGFPLHSVGDTNMHSTLVRTMTGTPCYDQQKLVTRNKWIN